MTGFLVVVSFEGEPPPDSPSDVVHEEPSGGFLGASMWLGLGESATAISLIHFADRESADAHLRERVESTDAPPRTLAIPPTVRHLCLVEGHGRTLDASSVGSYVSLVHTLAAPGYGAESGREVEETLEAISLIEGYAGHLRGFDVSLEDEVWALVFWDTPPVIEVPPDVAAVENYRRLR